MSRRSILSANEKLLFFVMNLPDKKNLAKKANLSIIVKNYLS